MYNIMNIKITAYGQFLYTFVRVKHLCMYIQRVCRFETIAVGMH